jgi:SPP1 family predicted phage head-tail adaptor
MRSIGALDQRVTLQSRSVVVDAVGQETITWADVATVWAQVEQLRGRELFAAAGTVYEGTTRIRIRYRSDVAATWRAVWGAMRMDIVSVIAVGGRNDMTEMLCLENVKDGR